MTPTEYNAEPLPVGGPDAAMTDQQPSQAPNQEPNGTRPTAVKVTMTLPVRVWDVVNRLADEQGISRTEMLRRCISTENWRHDVEQAGGEVQERAADGTVTRVKFPW